MINSISIFNYNVQVANEWCELQVNNKEPKVAISNQGHLIIYDQKPNSTIEKITSFVNRIINDFLCLLGYRSNDPQQIKKVFTEICMKAVIETKQSAVSLLPQNKQDFANLGNKLLNTGNNFLNKGKNLTGSNSRESTEDQKNRLNTVNTSQPQTITPNNDNPFSGIDVNRLLKIIPEVFGNIVLFGLL